VNNSAGLRGYPLGVAGAGLRRLGAIHGNIDKFVANRMKKRGMSWTIRGTSKDDEANKFNAGG
jgi:hypothetical protein